MKAEPGMISRQRLLRHKYRFRIIEGRREAAFFHIFLLVSQNMKVIRFMPLHFSETLAEALFSEVVPLGHFHRVADSREHAIIFFGNYHRSAAFGFCDIKPLSQSDGLGWVRH